MRTNLILVLVLITGWAFGQNSNVLDRYIKQGLDSNLAMKQQVFDVQKSMQDLKQARALFMPNLGFNASYSWAGGGRTIDVPVGDLLNPVYSTLNALTGTNAFPQIQNSKELLLPNDYQETKLRLIQPLFNTDIYFNYKAQKELVSVSEAKKQVYENELRYDITTAYLQYLQAIQAVNIYKQSRTTLEELRRVNQKLVDNNMRTRDVVYNADYELSKIDASIADAQKNVEVAKAYFNFLLNRQLSTDIEVDTTLQPSLANASVDELTQQALGNRNELHQLSFAINATHQAVNLAKYGRLLPTINAVGDLGYQGYKYKFNSDQQFYFVQLSLQWTLFSGLSKTAKLQSAKIDEYKLNTQYEQVQQQIGLQVTQAENELVAARQQLEATKSGVENAQKSFNIIDKKYKENQVLLLEYLDARNKLEVSQLQYNIARYGLLAKEAELKKTLATK